MITQNHSVKEKLTKISNLIKKKVKKAYLDRRQISFLKSLFYRKSAQNGLNLMKFDVQKQNLTCNGSCMTKNLQVKCENPS